ncbi:glycoside hydrolase family 18 protein [Mycena filopes]|nr:glycoside hydrolase family 18 protein [Mycena filopes]
MSWSTIMHSLSLLALFLASVRGTGGAKIASAWYAGWHASSDADPVFSVVNVSWKKYNDLVFAFGETTPDVSLNVPARVSIGGWTGSRYWSSNVATAENRTKFVATLSKLASDHDLDGLDFDWEAPNNQGIGCNIVGPNDTANFLAFIQELRKDPVGSKLKLVRRNGHHPILRSRCKVLDWVAIMAYDINGTRGGKNVGPNAPWHKAGMPLEQIVVGVASYGHSFRVAKADAFNKSDPSGAGLALNPPFNATSYPMGDTWDDVIDPTSNTDECGNVENQSGVIDFWGLIDQGYLNTDGTQKSGVPYLFNDCTQTPYVYNETTEVMISFDNAEFIRSQRQIHSAGGDSNDILLDSILKAAGLA